MNAIKENSNEILYETIKNKNCKMNKINMNGIK